MPIIPKSSAFSRETSFSRQFSGEANTSGDVNTHLKHTTPTKPTPPRIVPIISGVNAMAAPNYNIFGDSEEPALPLQDPRRPLLDLSLNTMNRVFKEELLERNSLQKKFLSAPITLRIDDNEGFSASACCTSSSGKYTAASEDEILYSSEELTPWLQWAAPKATSKARKRRSNTPDHNRSSATPSNNQVFAHDESGISPSTTPSRHLELALNGSARSTSTTPSKNQAFALKGSARCAASTPAKSQSSSPILGEEKDSLGQIEISFRAPYGNIPGIIVDSHQSKHVRSNLFGSYGGKPGDCFLVEHSTEKGFCELLDYLLTLDECAKLNEEISSTENIYLKEIAITINNRCMPYKEIRITGIVYNAKDKCWYLHIFPVLPKK